MDILTPTHSEQVPSALDNPSANILRPAQMAEHYNDLQVAKNDLENPKVQDKGAVRQRVNNLQRQYESQAPRAITDGATKDALAKEAETLLAHILPGMLSKEEMRKNPAGSVDLHLRWERANKARIKRWKKLQCVLNADASDPHTWDRDAANLERYRPDGPQDRFRADAQITGKMTYGNVPDEKWTQTFGHAHAENSALEQARKVAQETVTAAPAKPGRKPMSEAQRAVFKTNMAKARAMRQIGTKLPTL